MKIADKMEKIYNHPENGVGYEAYSTNNGPVPMEIGYVL